MSLLTKEQLIELSIKAIKDNMLTFIEDIMPYIGISKGTFYNHKLHELDELKEAIIANKIKAKSQLRRKWINSENPTLQIALYKLLSNEEERMALSGERTETDNKQTIVIQLPSELKEEE